MFTKMLIDIETGLPVHNAEIVSPVLNQLFAPFFDFPSYFLTMPEPKIQLLSWAVWLTTVWIIYWLIRQRGCRMKKIITLLRGILVIAVSLILFILYSIFVPLPQYRITSRNPDEVFLDLHSHTIYSHDGIVTPQRSFLWHINYGFDGWSTTEHDWIGNAPSIQREIILNKSLAATVIPGEEVNFKKVHLNLLGIREDVDTKRYKNIADLIENVHLQGGAVVVPHYWAETQSPSFMKDLAEAGVDGFEIAGNASIPLTYEKQQEIIALCRDEGLVMLSGTNWHGWRNFCTVWTGFKVEGWAQMSIEERERVVIEALRNRETSRFRVIGYRQRFPASIVHYIFEPFLGFFFYFTSTGIWQILSWLFWVVVIFFIIRSIKNKRLIAISLWSAISLLLVIKSGLVLNTWRTVADVNNILPDVAKGLLFMAVVTACLALTNLKIRKKPESHTR
jgi:hypothetical protein